MASPLDDPAPWRAFASGEYPELLELAARTDPREVKELARLKARFPAPLVVVALEIADARRRAAGRLEDAESLIADVAGVEQATRASVAAHKAKRFAGRGRVFDLCCGIGGDARHLARVGETIGVEKVPARVLMAERYARCAIETGEVADRKVDGEYVHVDPSRREGEQGKGASRRAKGLEDLRPGPNVLDRIVRASRGGALKLGPGIDLRDFPWLDRMEIEFVSDGGSLVSAIAWFGGDLAAPGTLRATRLPAGVSVAGRTLEPATAGDGTPRNLIYVPDPALERARLLGASGVAPPGAGLVELHPGLGILTSDEPVDSPWFEPYEVVASLPWREEKVRDWLRAHDGGTVEVKTRGGAVDATAAQKALRGEGAARYTIFVLRLGKPIVAVITKRGRSEPPGAPLP